MTEFTADEARLLGRIADASERMPGSIREHLAATDLQVASLRRYMAAQAIGIVVLAGLCLLLGLSVIDQRSAVRSTQLCTILGHQEQVPSVVEIRAELHCRDKPDPLVPVVVVPSASPFVVASPVVIPGPTVIVRQPTRVVPARQPAPSPSPTVRATPSAHPSASAPPTVAPTRAPSLCLLGVCL